MTEEKNDVLGETPIEAVFNEEAESIKTATLAKAGTTDTNTIESIHEDHHGGITVLFGREYPVPIYTSVFGALAVLTIIEVALAEVISSDAKIPILLGLAIAKAMLVVIFYMHLRTDSRVFALTLLIPVVVGLISALFLVAVPPTGGY